MSVFVCDHCKFVFESEEEVNQCPDCGKFKVRAATQPETDEYNNRMNDEEDVWK